MKKFPGVMCQGLQVAPCYPPITFNESSNPERGSTYSESTIEQKCYILDSYLALRMQLSTPAMAILYITFFESEIHELSRKGLDSGSIRYRALLQGHDVSGTVAAPPG
jgi:hypothetical protein